MRSHSSFLALAVASAFSAPLAAQGPMRVAPSGHAITEVTLTFVDSAARAAAKPAKISIDYGQPNLRGRKLLTDSLIPYDKAWRTGANGATTLTNDVDIVLGGATIPKGKWIVQSIPGKSGWKLLIQKEMNQSPMMAAMTHKPENDIARIDLKQTTLAAPLETFTIWLIPSREPGLPHGQLVLSWGTFSLSTDWSQK